MDFPGLVLDEFFKEAPNFRNQPRRAAETTQNPQFILDLAEGITAGKVTGEDPPQPFPDDVPGARLDADSLDVFSGKLYVIPEEIDVDFITEDIQRTIQIYSTFNTRVTITDVTIENVGGLILQTPPVPFIVCPSVEVLNTLTILKDGNPFQDSEIIYTRDAVETFSVIVTGRRVLPFIFEPNFTTVENGYGFDNVKFTDNIDNEQRRSLQGAKSRKETTFDIQEKRTNAQRVINEMKRWRNAVVAVPFFREAMKIVNDPEGGALLEIVEDFTFFFNLMTQADFVFIKDRNDPDVNEVKQIVSIDAGLKQITVNSNFVNNYPTKSTTVYPVFLAVPEQTVNFDIVKDDMIESKLKFTEFI